MVHRRRRRWPAVLAAGVAAAVAFIALPAGQAQQRAELDGATLLAEPTVVGDLIEARVEREVAECMARQGFDYEPDLPEAPDADVERGYGIATDPAEVGIDDPNLARLSDLSEEELVAYEVALYGAPLDELDGEPPPGGCAQEVAPLLEEIIAALRDVNDVFAGVAAAVESDPRLVAAEREWAACMEQNGLPYRGIGEPAADFAARLEAAGEGGAAELADEEARVAEIDEACRADTVDPVIDAIVSEQLPRLDAAAARLAEAVAE